MKSLFFRLYLWGMSLLASLRPIKEKNIVVLNGSGRSGSNGYLFYKYIKANHPGYDVTLVEPAIVTFVLGNVEKDWCSQVCDYYAPTF